jgi:hypothetical protein
VRRDQLAQPRRERRGAAQDLLREAAEVLRRLGQVGEQVPDLRVLGAVRRIWPIMSA